MQKKPLSIAQTGNQRVDELLENMWHDTFELMEYTDEEIEILKDDEETLDVFCKAAFRALREKALEEAASEEERNRIETDSIVDYLMGWLDSYVEELAEELLEQRDFVRKANN